MNNCQAQQTNTKKKKDLRVTRITRSHSRATLVDRLTNRRLCASLRDDLDGNIHPRGSLFYPYDAYDPILGRWGETSDHPRAHREWFEELVEINVRVLLADRSFARCFDSTILRFPRSILLYRGFSLSKRDTLKASAFVSVSLVNTKLPREHATRNDRRISTIKTLSRSYVRWNFARLRRRINKANKLTVSAILPRAGRCSKDWRTFGRCWIAHRSHVISKSRQTSGGPHISAGLFEATINMNSRRFDLIETPHTHAR